MYSSPFSVGHFATGPPPGRPALPLLKLNNKEKGLYSNLFSRADPDGTSKVEGRAAVEFFKKSALPVDVLKEIWNLASPNGESFLDRERFYIAVRLIALAQQGKPVSLDSITSNVEVDLPVFSGPAERSEGDGFEVSADERTKYELIFNNHGGGKGNLTGLEARALFERTGVDISELSRIWTLADPQDTGLLTKSQFIVAMHLVMKAKQRVRIPDVLPPSLSTILSAQAPSLYKEFGSLPSPSPPRPQEKKPDVLFDAFQDMPAASLSFPKPAPVVAKHIVEEKPPAANRQQLRLLDEPVQSLDLMGGDDPFAAISRPEAKRRDLEPRRDTQHVERLPDLMRRDPPIDPAPVEVRREVSFPSMPRIEEPVRDGAAKSYYPQREERRDDTAVLSLQKALKAMELQLEELNEELRSTKKEVRLTREDADQQLEDFSKEMRKQRDSMEQQMADLTKELKNERRSIVETVDTAKTIGKSLSDCLSSFATLRVQCEDALKQQQILTTQMQTAMQQSSAQQSKFLAQMAEMLERHKGELLTMSRRPVEQEPARTFEALTPTKNERLPEMRFEPQVKVEEKPKPPPAPAKPQAKPTSRFEPDFASQQPALPPEPKPAKEEVKEPIKKLGLEPPPSEDLKSLPKPVIDMKRKVEDEFEFEVEAKIVPQVSQKPEPPKDSPPQAAPKPIPPLEGFEFPSLEQSKNVGMTKSSPQVDEFHFEADSVGAFPALEAPASKPKDNPKAFEAMASRPKENPKTDFSAYEFDFAIGLPKAEPQKQAPKFDGKPEEQRRKSSNSSFDFDVGDDQPQVNQLPAGKVAESGIEDKGKGKEKDEFAFPSAPEFDFSKAPKVSTGFEFGDFKAFEGAFKPEFNADFQSGVFKFDTGAVQQNKKIAFEF